MRERTQTPEVEAGSGLTVEGSRERRETPETGREETPSGPVEKENHYGPQRTFWVKLHGRDKRQKHREVGKGTVVCSLRYRPRNYEVKGTTNTRGFLSFVQGKK